MIPNKTARRSKKSPRTPAELSYMGISCLRPSMDFIQSRMDDTLWGEAVTRAARTGQPVSECAVDVLVETIGILTACVGSIQHNDTVTPSTGVTVAPPLPAVSRRARGEK
jgi:hypothetical protein